MRKARDARAKADAEFVEKARSRAAAKSKGEAEISRLADKAREKNSSRQGRGRNQCYKEGVIGGCR